MNRVIDSMRIRHAIRLAAISVVVCACISRNSFADESQTISDDQLTFFESKIRPVLVQHCYECHSRESKTLQGGLRLDSRAGVLAGGDSGSAVVIGDPHDNLLVGSLEYGDDSFQMPPKGKLPDSVIADFRKWISIGLPDPRSTAAGISSPPVETGSPQEFWSFQPISPQEIPESQTGWARSNVDRFIEERITERELTPAADADKRNLVRRLYFDLIGLPPTEEQIESFLGDTKNNATDRLIDELLASDRFGERWARHWLDVVRYAESSGGGRTLIFPNAWRYRDYVINAFNTDKPYDQFLREQIAGDLLSAKTTEQQTEYTVATGFLALGPTNYELQDKDLLRMEVVDEQMDTIGRSMLGLTIGCARCHDHKFDPIPTNDYYAMAGIFRSTKTFTLGNVANFIERPLPSAEFNAISEAHAAKLATCQERLDSAEQRLAKVNRETEFLAASATVDQLKSELDELKSNTPTNPNMAMSVTEEVEPGDWHVHIRGQIRNLGPLVPRGFISVLGANTASSLPKDQSGRLELADWIANERNPLTARVMVNRIWQHLMGEGIVRSPDNFGTMGRRPTHPELLDYLSRKFIESGWSVKQIVREIVSSRAYGLSETGVSHVESLDPKNETFSYRSARRLDAESIRDAMLLVSGNLDLTMFGPTQSPGTSTELGYDFTSNRRTIYVPWFRNTQLDSLQIFDAANPNVVTGRRTVTSMPTQSLYLMNSEFVQTAARNFAERLLAVATDDSERIDRAFQIATGRPARDTERKVLLAYLDEQRLTGYEAVDYWTCVCHLILASVDFRSV